MIKLAKIFIPDKTIKVVFLSLCVVGFDVVFALVIADIITICQGGNKFYLLGLGKYFFNANALLYATVIIAIRYPLLQRIHTYINYQVYKVYTEASQNLLKHHLEEEENCSKITHKGFSNKAFSQDMNTFVGGIFMPAVFVFVEVLTLVVLSGLLLHQISVSFGGFFLCVVIFMAIFAMSFAFTKVLRIEGNKRNENEKEKSAWLISLEHAYKELITFKGVDYYCEKYYRLNKLISQSAVKITSALAISKVAVETVYGVCLLFIGYYLSISIKSTSPLSDAHLSLFIAFIVKLMPSVSRISQSAMSVIGSYIILHDMRQSNGKGTQSLKFSGRLNVAGKSISIDDLCVKGGGEHLLTGEHIRIPKNKITVVLGASGSGKSVFLKAIKKQLDSKKTSVGFLRQDIGFVADGVYQNIAFESNISDRAKEKINQILLRLGFKKDFLLEIDKISIDQLSGGQQQRIGLARCLYHDSNILLLDEFTSALDQDVELEILKLLKSLDGVTIVCAAHREIFRKIGDYYLTITDNVIRESKIAMREDIV